MVIQNSLKLLKDLCEIETKIKQVEHVLSEQEIPLDEELIVKILKAKLVS